jgi:hypothetical protein
MGSRADRRARRIATMAGFKEAFTQGLIANKDIDPDKPIIEIKQAIADSMTKVYLQLIKDNPPQEKALIRDAMDEFIKELPAE